MENTPKTRKDLLNHFPTSYLHSDLKKHFSCEYVKLFGFEPEEKDAETLARTFARAWKTVRNKKLFLLLIVLLYFIEIEVLSRF